MGIPTVLCSLLHRSDLRPKLGISLIERRTPFFYVIDGFRRGFFGISDVSPWLSLAVVSVTLLAVCVLNVQLLRSGYKIRG